MILKRNGKFMVHVDMDCENGNVTRLLDVEKLFGVKVDRRFYNKMTKEASKDLEEFRAKDDLKPWYKKIF